jgi:REP element-mobilizing transposase RayT
MQLSSIGKITYTELLKTQEIRNNVVIDEWVIMPDHIHMIIRIVEPPTVETHCSASLHPPPTQPDTPPKNRFGPQSNNIPAIVRGIKSAVKRKTNAQSIEFQWQARYHDHIIRGQAELERIRRYIKNNVVAWGNDARDK